MVEVQLGGKSLTQLKVDDVFGEMSMLKNFVFANVLCSKFWEATLFQIFAKRFLV